MTSKKGFPAELQTLDKAARSGSRGVTSLFSGAAGSGKMKAAMDIASSLDAPLLKVNLKTVLSKYIGETEKNLFATGLISVEEAAHIIGRSTGNHYSCSPHHYDSGIEVGYENRKSG